MSCVPFLFPQRNEAIAKHAEILRLLTKYMAADRIAKAIAEFEIIIKDMPDSEEARKAAAAIEALKAAPDARTSALDPNGVIFGRGTTTDPFSLEPTEAPPKFNHISPREKVIPKRQSTPEPEESPRKRDDVEELKR